MALGLAESPGHGGRAPGPGGTWSGRCSAWSRSCLSPRGGGAGHCARAGDTHLAWGAHRITPVISWPRTARAQPGVWQCLSSLQQLQASLGNAIGTQTPTSPGGRTPSSSPQSQRQSPDSSGVITRPSPAALTGVAEGSSPVIQDNLDF